MLQLLQSKSLGLKDVKYLEFSRDQILADVQQDQPMTTWTVQIFGLF